MYARDVLDFSKPPIYGYLREMPHRARGHVGAVCHWVLVPAAGLNKRTFELQPS